MSPAAKLGRKRGKDGWITVTPFDPLPEAPNLTAVKIETVATWPMTSLLDMLKEADLRLNFTDVLKSVTAYETFDRAVLRPAHSLGPCRGMPTRWCAGTSPEAGGANLPHHRARLRGSDCLSRPKRGRAAYDRQPLELGIANADGIFSGRHMALPCSMNSRKSTDRCR